MTPALRQKTKQALARFPGVLEAALTVKHALRPPPTGAFPGRLLHAWLDELAAAPPLPDARPERRVLVFACRQQWLRLSLATSVVLLGRNCRVDFAYCRYSEVSREESPVDTKEFRFYWSRFFQDRCHPRLRFVDLTRMDPAPLPPALLDQAADQTLLDTRWVLQREEIDVDGDPEHRAVYEFRLRRNRECMARMLALLADRAYDVVLLPHGNLRELGAAFRAARHAGLPVVSYDFKERAEAIVFSNHNAVSHMDTSREWAADKPHVLSEPVRERVRAFMSNRLDAQWKGFSWAHQYVCYDGDRERVRDRLNLPPGGPVALLCPNVAWDSSLLGRDRAFRSLVDWVRHTVRFFAERPQTRLIVRAHPAEEMFGSSQRVTQVAREACPRLPDHLRIVAAQDPINTYDLMDLCDFGLVYNSTAGLEMALRGIPTLVCGRPHYGEKGFTFDIFTHQDYHATLESLLAAPAARLSDRQIELAWCYADVFFYRWHHPFPWCMTTFWKDLERWPLRRVLSPEGQARFGPTFDRLVNREV